MADPKRVSLISLGCVKNVVDSEKMLGQFAQAGCVIAGEEDAEVLVINTCGFLSAAREEADEVIADALQRKAEGLVSRVVVVGCLVQRDKEAILDRLPAVDAIVGVHNRDDVVRAVLGTSSTASQPAPDVFLGDYHPHTQSDTARLRITPRHYAYLRISEGCDHRCTFCTIPAIRGPMHCKPPEAILSEAHELVSDGAVEIHLIGQDTTSYGLAGDGFDGGLAKLLRQLDRVDGLAWIRLMYAYPTALSDDIIAAIADCEHVCKYVDVPLQHISDRVLKAMGRRTSRAETERLLHKLRDRIPDVTIRTTLIAGFPGETQEEFDELLQFVGDFGFDALGVFGYSSEPDTPSGAMENQLSADTIQQRADALMLAQQENAFRLARQRVGGTGVVLVDERLEDGIVVGRHEGQAPDVDSLTYIEDCTATPGTFVKVRYTAQDDYDLKATPT